MATGAVSDGAVKQRNAMGRDVLVVEGPASLQVNEALAGAVAARETPGVFGVDAVRCGVEVDLVCRARVVDGRDRGIRAGTIDVGRFDVLPPRHHLGHGVEIDLGRCVDSEVAGQPGLLIAGVHLGGLGLKLADSTLVQRGEQGDEPHVREVVLELLPGGEAAFDELAFGAGFVGEVDLFPEGDYDVGL